MAVLPRVVKKYGDGAFVVVAHQQIATFQIHGVVLLFGCALGGVLSVHIEDYQCEFVVVAFVVRYLFVACNPKCFFQPQPGVVVGGSDDGGIGLGAVVADMHVFDIGNIQVVVWGIGVEYMHLSPRDGHSRHYGEGEKYNLFHISRSLLKVSLHIPIVALDCNHGCISRVEQYLRLEVPCFRIRQWQCPRWEVPLLHIK